MQQHQLRVLDEKRELDEKIEKLHEFFQTPLFKLDGGVSNDEKCLLRIQYKAMTEYSTILGMRIASFDMVEAG